MVLVKYEESECEDSFADFFGDPSNSEDGFCYVKTILSKSDTLSSSYFIPVYFGSEQNMEGVQPIKFLVHEKRTEWIQRYDDGCGDKNSPLCYTWSLIEIPAKTVTVQSVTDTIRVDEFYQKEIRTLSIHKRKWKSWVKIICEKDINKTLIQKVVAALKTKGFDNIGVHSEMDFNLKMALSKYQSDRNLPIGSLNLETLEALGIKYP